MDGIVIELGDGDLRDGKDVVEGGLKGTDENVVLTTATAAGGVVVVVNDRENENVKKSSIEPMITDNNNYDNDNDNDDNNDDDKELVSPQQQGGKQKNQTWSQDEDQRLVALVERFGSKKWSFIAQMMSNRHGKQCRDRFINHLSPDIKKGDWSAEEELIFVEGHKALGTKWASLAHILPGRPENAVKNHWHATKRAKFEPKCLLKPLFMYQMNVLKIAGLDVTEEEYAKAKLVAETFKQQDSSPDADLGGKQTDDNKDDEKDQDDMEKAQQELRAKIELLKKKQSVVSFITNQITANGGGRFYGKFDAVNSPASDAIGEIIVNEPTKKARTKSTIWKQPSHWQNNEDVNEDDDDIDDDVNDDDDDDDDVSEDIVIRNGNMAPIDAIAAAAENLATAEEQNDSRLKKITPTTTTTTKGGAAVVAAAEMKETGVVENEAFGTFRKIKGLLGGDALTPMVSTFRQLHEVLPIPQKNTRKPKVHFEKPDDIPLDNQQASDVSSRGRVRVKTKPKLLPPRVKQEKALAPAPAPKPITQKTAKYRPQYFRDSMKLAKYDVNNNKNLNIIDTKNMNNNNSNNNKMVIFNEEAPKKEASQQPKKRKKNKDTLNKRPRNPNTFDGYSWRKYGEKIIKGVEHPRAYYKCVEINCPARKIMEDGNVTYTGEHAHEPPEFTNLAQKKQKQRETEGAAKVLGNLGNDDQHYYYDNANNNDDDDDDDANNRREKDYDNDREDSGGNRAYERELDIILAAANHAQQGGGGYEDYEEDDYEEEEEAQEEEEEDDDYDELDPKVLEAKRIAWIEKEFFGGTKTKLSPSEAYEYQRQNQSTKGPKRGLASKKNKKNINKKAAAKESKSAAAVRKMMNASSKSKAGRIGPKSNYQGACQLCGSQNTPCWRNVGSLKLCNACGIRLYREYASEKEEAKTLLQFANVTDIDPNDVDGDVAGRFKTDQSDIEKFALREYPGLQRAIDQPGTFAVNIGASGRAALDAVHRSNTDGTQGYPPKKQIRKPKKNTNSSHRAAEKAIIQAVTLKQRVNKRALTLDEITAVNEKDIFLVQHQRLAFESSYIQSNDDKAGGDDDDQKDSYHYFLPIKKRKAVKLNENGTFTAIDTITGEEIPKYLNDMQMLTMKNPLSLLASTIDLRLDEDNTTTIEEEDDEDNDDDDDDDDGGEMNATEGGQQRQQQQQQRDGNNNNTTTNDFTTAYGAGFTTMTNNNNNNIEGNSLQEMQQEGGSGGGYNKKSADRIFKAGNLTAVKNGIVVDDFIEVTEFPLDTNRCITAARSRKNGNFLLEVAVLTTNASCNGPINIRGPDKVISREELKDGFQKIAINARKKIASLKSKRLGDGLSGVIRDAAETTSARFAISCRENSCKTGDLQLVICCASESFREAIDAAEYCANQIKRDFNFSYSSSLPAQEQQQQQQQQQQQEDDEEEFEEEQRHENQFGIFL